MMIDGLFHGLFGGLFGPAIAHWMSKFRYWAIFLVAMLSTKLLSVAFMLKELGFEKTVESFEKGIHPSFFYVPVMIGAMAVFIAFLGSLSAPKENGENTGQDR